MSHHKNSCLATWGKTFLLLLTAFFILFPETGKISSSALAQPPVHFSKWTEIAPMPTARDSLLVLKQHDGRIVAIGGEAVSGVSNAVERFDPNTHTWDRALSPYPVAVSYLSGATLPDGRLFATGGFNSSGFVRDSYLFDPQKGSWTPTAPDPVARAGSMAIVLAGGDVLVTGGETENGITGVTEGFRPSENRWVSRESAPEERLGGVAARMPDGRVLLGVGFVGGHGPPRIMHQVIMRRGLHRLDLPQKLGKTDVVDRLEGGFLHDDDFVRTFGDRNRLDVEAGRLVVQKVLIVCDLMFAARGTGRREQKDKNEECQALDHASPFRVVRKIGQTA